MGEARRRKQLGIYPEKTPKPETKGRIKRDSDIYTIPPNLIGSYFTTMAILAGYSQRESRTDE